MSGAGFAGKHGGRLSCPRSSDGFKGLAAPAPRAPALPRREPSANDLLSAPVAQLDRALPSEGRGREFESRRARHDFNGLASLVKSHLLAGKQWVSKRQKIEPP